jgi:hypothetical protein
MLCQAEEGLLLGVGEGEGFEAAEDNWVCWNVLVEGADIFNEGWCGIRYATTTEHFFSMASFATAVVRSMVRRTEFLCLRELSKGASSNTTIEQGLAHL